MGTWQNSDGLRVKLGTSEGVSTHAAGTWSVGDMNVCQVVVNMASLTQTETILNDVAWIPANAHITKVEVITVVAATTGTAMDLGLIDQDYTAEIDYDGFLAAIPTAEMAQVGETRKYYETHTEPTTMTGTGALVGQEVTNAGYISASMTDATAFGAGKVKVRIYYIPKGIDITG